MMIDIIASLFISVLAGMGVGGGGLLVLYLALVKNTDQLTSQGINLFFFLAASCSALAVNIKKRTLDLKYIATLALFGTPFALLGAIIACNTDTALLRKLFGALLILSGALSFAKKK